jgi:sec-independent protein translocase protein TatC
MLLTPPDIFSQTMLAIPVWILFEVGLFASRRFFKPTDSSEEDEEAEFDMDSEFEAAESQLESLDSKPDEGP